VNLRENSELIKYYLRFLKLRKEEFIKNYKPSDWELLSREEQIQIAIARIHREEDDTLAAKILVNEALREYKEYKRELRLRSKPNLLFLFLTKLNIPISIVSRIIPSVCICHIREQQPYYFGGFL
jgi:hypothetical protein